MRNEKRQFYAAAEEQYNIVIVERSLRFDDIIWSEKDFSVL